jgi:hypothetical protein
VEQEVLYLMHLLGQQPQVMVKVDLYQIQDILLVVEVEERILDHLVTLQVV